MRDIKELDSRGIPGGFLASEVFRDAAAAQARDLGFPARRHFVPHPIQDRTDDEIRALAEDAFESVLAMLAESAA